MIALIDTPVWSEYFRRRSPLPQVQNKVEELLAQNGALLIGPIRQELLSGLREQSQFERLRAELRNIADYPIETEDYERGAEFSNTCRSKGIQGSATDFLMCAIAVREQVEIFTLDHDFQNYRSVIPVLLTEI